MLFRAVDLHFALVLLLTQQTKAILKRSDAFGQVPDWMVRVGCQVSGRARVMGTNRLILNYFSHHQSCYRAVLLGPRSSTSNAGKRVVEWQARQSKAPCDYFFAAARTARRCLAGCYSVVQKCRAFSRVCRSPWLVTASKRLICVCPGIQSFTLA